MLHFYRLVDKGFEYCFNIETSAKLNQSELKILKWLMAETFEPGKFGKSSYLIDTASTGKDKEEPDPIKKPQDKILEIGPRLNFETAYSTNAVAVCHACGIHKISRMERSRRYLLAANKKLLKAQKNVSSFISGQHDRMTEFVYPKPLNTFRTGIAPEKVYRVPLLEKGREALESINVEYGLGFDDWDLDFYYKLFALDFKRDPTNVEIYQLSQANSEHSRHWFFKGKLAIDGKEMDITLLQMIKSTLESNKNNSLIAFSDNSSALKGDRINTITPRIPGFCSPFKERKCYYHIIFTAETHNFPSGVAPFPGAETGTGGRIRDVQATGRGGLVVAGTAGYATGNLNIPGYKIAGESSGYEYPPNLASPLKIMIEESNGASDYGNKFGEPVIQGFTRTFGLTTSDGERREWVKPIMFTGGAGQIDDRHLKKYEPEKGMLVIQVGGPAYRIGIGGGSASSLIQGENREELDFNAVQRGNAEMEQKLNRVIRACIEMGEENPILSVHDQGAGGPCNVLTEIVDPAGGRIEIRNICLGDKTMSVLEVWVAEYQERNAFLLYSRSLEKFQEICKREKVSCEVLGKISGNGKITVHDSKDGSLPVDLELSRILGKIPQKRFKLDHLCSKLEPLHLPENFVLEKAIKDIFSLPAVGSKGFLVKKVDRSVTGLVARQQCCGPLQLPLCDVSIIAQSHFGLTGAALSIGEQPLKMLVNPAAGARMAVAEALTNMMWAAVTDISHIKCSVNWMWPAKLPGEGALLWDAALAMTGIMKFLGIAADGGKDSVSMAAHLKDKIIKAPGQVVVSAYVTVPDINMVITPDLKAAGSSSLLFVDISAGRKRLGGSAFAQTLKQVGDDCPDIDDAALLKNAFLAVQDLIGKGLLLAGHDISDGGFITTLAEMVMGGNCGARIDIKDFSLKNCTDSKSRVFTEGVMEKLLCEEAGIIMEYYTRDEKEVISELDGLKLPYLVLGKTLKEKKLLIGNRGKTLLDIDTSKLLQWWESTSDELEKNQMDPDYALSQKKVHMRKGPSYHLAFTPERTPEGVMESISKPKVAVIREEGSNGDREMASAFYMAGFEPWDITMTDLLNVKASLEDFRGVVFVGGFSYADVLDSAKGWAGIIKFHPGLAAMFRDFYMRPDTFSLGVCNGCQLMSLLGWVPFYNLKETGQPRFISNPSGRFESRWITVKISKSPSIMLRDMQDSIMGIWVAHREGHLYFPDPGIFQKSKEKHLTPICYVDDEGLPTEAYPFNPNSSPEGITALCSEDGRHLAVMPHPERSFLLWQWPWVPQNLKVTLGASPWLRMFQNARTWCEENS